MKNVKKTLRKYGLTDDWVRWLIVGFFTVWVFAGILGEIYGR